MQDLGFQFVVHYLDDILIHTKGVNEHTDSLELKPSKTLLFQKQVTF